MKTSIRFYNDREVRAVWDENQNKWWFSAVDIVAAITESPNPRKYWSVLKTRLRKAGNKLTTKCSQLKMTAADGKKYATDCFSQDDITDLVNRWVKERRISDYGNSRKGDLWAILYDAGLYPKSRQNWNRRVY